LKVKELWGNEMIVKSERGNEALIKVSDEGISVLFQTFTEKILKYSNRGAEVRTMAEEK